MDAEDSNLWTYCMTPGPSRIAFVPQQDITAYELAILLPLFLGGTTLTQANMDALGDATRHLKRAD